MTDKRWKEVRKLWRGLGGKPPPKKTKKYLKKQDPQRTIMVFLRAKGMYPLTQLSQLGIEIDTFDSANKVSFHHKADHLADDCIPSVVAASAISH